ncbi:MAG: TonB-dependent receptor [Saprospiraceae bacterium]|nr:TonB-dependent receptor [Saprospiraceae bacterium]
MPSSENVVTETIGPTVSVVYPKSIRSDKHNFVGTHHDYLNDSVLRQHANGNLADLLTRESHVFIKNYGPSNIATPSNRGGSSSQTSITWEGIDLQNRMLGQTDLSIIPNAFINAAFINYGNSTENLAGGIHLHTITALNQGFKVAGQLTYGSFYNTNAQLNLAYSGAKYGGSIRSFFRWGLNNFKYLDVNAFGQPKPKVNQEHAAVLQYGVLQENTFQVNKLNILEFKTWYQYSNRQLPPSLIQDTSTDVQLDQSLRSVLKWSALFPNQNLRLNTHHAATWDYLEFTNLGIDSESRILSIYNQADLQWQQYFPVSLSIRHLYANANSTGYEDLAQQHQFRFKWSVRPKFKKVFLRFQLQEDWVGGQWSLPAFQVGMNWFPKSFLAIKASAGHQYRFPTFNDLFWSNLGNPNLKPEYNWSLELGTALTVNIGNRHRLIWDNAIYSNWVRDWLLWRPDSQGAWRPENVDRVWSKGIETKLDWTCQINKKWKFRLHGLYNWNLAIRTGGSSANLLGKQLIYTPEHQGTLSAQLAWKQLGFVYQHQWVGNRFIDAVNTDDLPMYHLGNVEINYKQKIKASNLNFFVKIYNIFGHNYQVISNRVMPWQQLECGIRFYQ